MELQRLTVGCPCCGDDVLYVNVDGDGEYRPLFLELGSIYTELEEGLEIIVSLHTCVPAKGSWVIDGVESEES